jgi:hypothetical protein
MKLASPMASVTSLMSSDGLIGTSVCLENLAQRLDQTGVAAAESLRRYGIEPGEATAPPW